MTIHTINHLHDLYKIPSDKIEDALDELIEHMGKWYYVATESRAGAEIALNVKFTYDDGVKDD